MPPLAVQQPRRFPLAVCSSGPKRNSYVPHVSTITYTHIWGFANWGTTGQVIFINFKLKKPLSRSQQLMFFFCMHDKSAVNRKEIARLPNFFPFKIDSHIANISICSKVFVMCSNLMFKIRIHISLIYASRSHEKACKLPRKYNTASLIWPPNNFLDVDESTQLLLSKIHWIQIRTLNYLPQSN